MQRSAPAVRALAGALLLGLAQCQSDAPAAPDLSAGAPDLSAAADLSAPVGSTTDLAAPADLSPAPDLTPANQGVVCGLDVCPSGQRCCGILGPPPALSCQPAACAAGSTITGACDGPEDCGAAAPYCCTSLKIGPGVAPQCPLTAISASCAATCQGSVGFVCNTTSAARLCHGAADCGGDPQYRNCCEFTVDNALFLRMCVTDAYKVLASRCLP